MKRAYRWSWLVVALLVLAACGAPPSPATELETEAGSQPGTDAQAGEESAAENGGGAAGSSNEDRSGVAFSPAATLAEAAEERERDYAKGSENPVLTIIEYGDFQ